MDNNISACDDMDEFKSTFFEECGELLIVIDGRLDELNGAPIDTAGINELFRAVHTIKGSAGFFNLNAIVSFAHTFETLLSAIRDARITQTRFSSNLLVEAADALSTIFEAARNDQALPPGYGSAIIAKMEELLAKAEVSDDKYSSAAELDPAQATELREIALRFTLLSTPGNPKPAHEPLLAELRNLGEVSDISQSIIDNGNQDFTCRLITSSTDDRIRDLFAFVDHEISICPRHETPAERPAASVAISIAAPASETDAPSDALPEAANKAGGEDSAHAKGQSQNSTIRVELSRVDRLVNMVGELVIAQAMLAQQIADQDASARPQLRQGHEELAHYTRELQECVMAIRMQPVKSVFSRMPRLVREIATKLGKRVRLVTRGEQTEVDKTVIEELADPLLHMIRNAIDHGIETAEVRSRAGKPEVGTIELSATQRGGSILISISDDGAGIDRDRLRRKAVERGIISADASLSGDDIDHLIFSPGFSTAEKVTDVSGRGVGMDVVRSNISKLGGRVQIQSTFGSGTKFTLLLPLTLAVLDGMLVAVSNETYILPLTSIVETVRPESHAVRQIANGSLVLAIRGEFIRLIGLGDVFGLPDAIAEPWRALVVIVELDNGTKVGLVVDELIGQRQVVVKSLQNNSAPVPGISGGTILGTGRVALILDIELLSRLSTRHLRAPTQDVIVNVPPSTQKSIPSEARAASFAA